MLTPLLLGVIGFLLFESLPLNQALYIFVPIAGVFIAVSLAIRHQVAKAMKLPIKTGVEDMVGKTAKVISVSEAAVRAGYVVRYGSELWGANSKDILCVGDRVMVVAVVGNVLVVERAAEGSGL